MPFRKHKILPSYLKINAYISLFFIIFRLDAYSIKPDADKSISYYKKALEVAREIDDKTSITIALNELAVVL